MTAVREAKAPGEARLWAELWPLLLASAVSLLPFTLYSTFLVPIAESVRGDVAAVGALRGVGGVCALVVGVAMAPLLDRFTKRRTSAAALSLLAAGSLVALHGSYISLVICCAAIGTATAVLTPALLAAAAERYDDELVAGRAATLVTAAQSLAAVAAGPFIGLIAAPAGWRGGMAVIALIAVVLAAGFARRAGRTRRPVAAQRPPGYLRAFRSLAGRPVLAGLILAAGLRTTAFMGQLAYLAAWYDHAFELGASMFTLVWTVSGLAFFGGNYLAGRWIGRVGSPGGAVAVMIAGLAAATAGLLALFWAPTLTVALAATASQAAGHAVAAAAITALIVRLGGPVRAAALSLNSAAMSLGVFAGAALGGAGLALAGYPGIATALALPMVAAVAVASALGIAMRGQRSG